MEISAEIRTKIAQLDELATAIHEYLYEIEGNDEEDLTEEQIEARSELQCALTDINDKVTSLQENENWI